MVLGGWARLPRVLEGPIVSNPADFNADQPRKARDDATGDLTARRMQKLRHPRDVIEYLTLLDNLCMN